MITEVADTDEVAPVAVIYELLSPYELILTVVPATAMPLRSIREERSNLMIVNNLFLRFSSSLCRNTHSHERREAERPVPKPLT